MATKSGISLGSAAIGGVVGATAAFLLHSQLEGVYKAVVDAWPGMSAKAKENLAKAKDEKAKEEKK